jgi:hypothetical protein
MTQMYADENRPPSAFYLRHLRMKLLHQQIERGQKVPSLTTIPSPRCRPRLQCDDMRGLKSSDYQ